jgi:L-threonylcarbamoyladenylate synthase
MTLVGNDLIQAANFLKGGEIVAIPTETVYGLGGNALDENAVLKIFEAKNRPFFDPLILHTHSVKELSKFTKEIHPKLLALLEQFSPGPLTVLLPKKEIVPDLVTAGLEQVAVRIPNHELTLQLLQMLDFPLAAPSANPFGYVSPTSAQHVFDQLNGKLSYILDGGECQVGIESTIVGMEANEVVVYRLGGLALEQIESVVGKVRVQINQSSNPKSPGMLKSHYAPLKQLVVGNLEELMQEYADQNFGVISFFEKTLVPHQIILSEKKDIHEAAKNLFAAMRTLDKTSVDLILAERLPDKGLGRAINDRLERAASKD